MFKVYGRIYKIKNTINEKIYTGKTTRSIKERSSNHSRSKIIDACRKIRKTAGGIHNGTGTKK